METLEGDLCDYESLSTLKVVNLSRTSIQSLPPSVSKLTSLVNLTLQECSMLTKLPPEIGRLKNLKMFDLEGTEIMYFPKEMGNLENLECLRVSLCTYAAQFKESNGIEYIIPRTLILNFMKLEELSIGINPDAKWWEVELVEAILGNLHMLSCLKTLKLYFPTAKELRYLSRHENIQPPMYSRLRDFRLKVGHTEQQLASCLPSQLVEGFDQLEKCLKYENGEASSDEIEGLIGHAKALFMRRHWTLEKLSIFDISKLKYCLVAECNEMHTIVDARDVYGKGSAFNHDKKFAFDSVEYLAIYSMKKLKSIWKGPILGNSFTLLQVLALHTCPDLTTVFTEGMLNKLNRLTVLIVEDCPKVKTLVSREDTSTRKSYGPYLPNLKNILLLNLPEFVSISSGVCIAPQLDTLLVFNCLKLGDLNRVGSSNDVRKIKGETEWWDALKCIHPEYSRAFVTLKRDGDLMNQLSEDTNSLKQFCKLQCQGAALSTSGSDIVHLDHSQPLPNQQKNKPRHILLSGINRQRIVREDQPEKINRRASFASGSNLFDREHSQALLNTDSIQIIRAFANKFFVNEHAQLEEKINIKEWDNVKSVDNNLSDPFSTFESIMQEHFKSTYLSITTPHSGFPELLEDDYLKWTTITPKVITDLRNHAMWVNSTGNIKRCVKIYISQRKIILQRFQTSARKRFEWGVVDSGIQDWIKSVQICLVHDLFAKEKQLCEEIFEGLETTIDDIVYMVIIQDYEIQVSDIIYAMSRGNMPPDKLFMILDMYETLDRFLSEMCVVIKPKDPTFGTRLFPVLADYITNSLSMFEMVLMYHESSVIFVGPVDPLPEYVMSYLCQLCDNKHTVMKLSLTALPTIDADDLTNLNCEEFKGKSEMSCHVIWIIMILVSNLESGAKLCEDGSAGLFFAMKNIGYVVQKIEGHLELMEVVGDGYLGKLIQKLNLIKFKYLMLEIEKMRDMRSYSIMV